MFVDKRETTKRSRNTATTECQQQSSLSTVGEGHKVLPNLSRCKKENPENIKKMNKNGVKKQQKKQRSKEKDTITKGDMSNKNPLNKT